LLNKQNGYDDKKNTFNHHFHFLHNKQQYVNNNNNTRVQELKNKLNHKSTNNNNTKGKIMFQTLNGFNIGLNRRLREVQSKNKKI
jgi:plasmid rolling circle replication initiator protein Rep